MNGHYKKIFQLCLYAVLCLLIIAYFCGEKCRTDVEHTTNTVTTTIKQAGNNNCTIQAGIESAGQSIGNVTDRIDHSQNSVSGAKRRIAKIRADLSEAEQVVRECQTILQETGKESVPLNP